MFYLWEEQKRFGDVEDEVDDEGDPSKGQDQVNMWE